MQRFKNILFITLRANDIGQALQRALELAVRNDAALTVFGAVAEPSRMSRALHPLQSRLPELVAGDLRQRLQADVDELDATHPVDVDVAIGVPFVAIIERILAEGHDLLIVADDGPDGPATSTTKHLLRKCPCPVWVMRPPSSPRELVLAAVDPGPDKIGTELNTLILDLAASQAVAADADLQIVHAWTMYGESTLRSSPFAKVSSDKLDALLDETRAGHSRSLKTLLADRALRVADDHVHLVKGHPGDVIPALVTELGISLLVMGTVTTVSVPGLIMGSSAERILDQVHCSVLAVKPKGFVSPVGRGTRRPASS